MRRFLLCLAMSLVLANCSFQVDRPESFQTVSRGADAAGDIALPDLIVPDGGVDGVGKDCTKDSDCPPGTDPCFKPRCINDECAMEPQKGADCEDGDLCTIGDACNIKGECLPGAPKVCTESSDPCEVVECVPESGACQGFFLPGCGACIEEAGTFMVGEGECCEGLKTLMDCVSPDACPPGEGCCECNEDVRICLDCGDGKCQGAENPCNCPDDCASMEEECFFMGGECVGNTMDDCPPETMPIPEEGLCFDGKVCCVPEMPSCLGAGQSGAVNGPEVCCPGLSKMPYAIVAENGDCKEDTANFVCAHCGDTICQAGEMENLCSCPKDCQNTECQDDADCGDDKVCYNGICRYCAPNEICNDYDDDCDGKVDEDCQSVFFAEICGDQLDNDEDGVIDEGVCVKDLCPGELPFFYTKAKLHQVADDPTPLAGQFVAMSGRAAFGFGGCADVECAWNLELVEQGINPPSIVVSASPQYPNVGCTSDNLVPTPDKCEPLALGKNYIVWGQWEKNSDSSDGAFHLLLHGFCKP